MKPLNRKRILVVDDEASFTHLLKLNLEQDDDYEVRVVIEANRAVAAAREFRPDVILLDLVMPQLSGGQVVQRLAADETVKDTPVVFLSGVPDRNCVAEDPALLNRGPLLFKPATVDQIVESIEQRLSAPDSWNGRIRVDDSAASEV
jgi:DNA-binding response OmpR family regulator